ncbi:hypothetical protein DFS33DRAFT_1273729 [Desarmillaria ectypa]|nr:hypothetical protein DFS33DRAFT_1273729 [Desarmillaria ectypa]
MAFFPDGSIFQQGVDEMLFNPGSSSMHAEMTSSAPFTKVDQYYSPTGEVSFSPPPIAENAFMFGHPMFYSDFHPDITNELSYFNLYSSSFDPSVVEPAKASVSYSASPSSPHIGSTDEDAEYDLDPEYDSTSGGACDSMECFSTTEDPSTATLFSQPSSSSGGRDRSPSSSSSDPCTVVDSRDADYHPCAEDSSDTCCSDGDESDYDEPATGTRKRVRTSKTTSQTPSESPKPKRGKKANFKKSSERWSFHDRRVRLRCMFPTCDAELWSINSAVDHFHDEHSEDEKPDVVRCSYFGCKETARSVGDMRRHFLTKTHEPHHFKCESCQTMFTRRDPMLRHMRNFQGRCKNRTAKRGPAKKPKKSVRAREA